MKKAIILFNLGGPDKLENVKPFLFNLFNDPAIINLPTFFRYPLAKLIAKKREPVAQKIYQELGGSSPILKLTKDQSSALENNLNKKEYILIFVQSKRFEIIKRLKKRNNFNQKLFNKFKNIQLPLDYKKNKSQFIIKNNFTKKSVMIHIQNILNEIM